MKRHISTSSEKYKNMSIDQKIKVIEAKLRYAINARKVPYRYLTVNKLNEILDDLYEEKYNQLYNSNINNENINVPEEENKKNNDKIFVDMDVRSEVYKKLSDEEKLNVVRGKLTKLFENTSDKVIVVIYNGQKKQVNKDKQGEYKDLVEREKKLKDILNKKHTNVEYVNKNKVNKFSFYDKYVTPFVTKTTDKIGKLLNKVKNIFNKDSKNNTKTKNEKSLKTKIIVAWGTFKSKLKKENKETITTVGKKDNTKKKITAVLLALTIFITGIGLSKCNKNSNTNNNAVTNNTSQHNNNSNNNNNNNNSNSNNNNNTDIEIDNENNNANNDKEENESFKLSFDDIVTINDNSFIYTNSYDATNNINSRNPYYNENYERDVRGLVYELNRKIYVVYEDGVNALEKQKQLENSGAIMTAVLVERNDLTHTGEYEGYYNISSVKVKSR